MRTLSVSDVPPPPTFRGCVTPNVIQNLKDAIKDISGGDETDCSALDGFDELSEENQDKVRRALEQGHVDDEDWKGVSFSLSFSWCRWGLVGVGAICLLVGQ